MRILLLALGLALVGALPAAGDAPQAVSSYYLARPDPRLCPSPRCGGLWVRLVNESRTTCGDGTEQRECYVAGMHLSRFRLSEQHAVRLTQLISTGRAIVRGRLVPETIQSVPLDGFVASEVWTASRGGSAPTGSFRKLVDSGIRCVTSPCFSIHAAALNSGRHVNVSDVDLRGSGASAAERGAALALIGRRGLIAAGKIVRVPDAGPAGTGRTVVASQFYIRATR